MSFALQALVLIQLESRSGQWCALNWLSEQLRVPADKLQPVCTGMAADGQLLHAVVGDIDSFRLPEHASEVPA